MCNVKKMYCENFPEFTHLLIEIAFKCYNDFKPITNFEAIVTREAFVQLKTFSAKKDVVVTKLGNSKGAVVIDRNRYLDSLTAPVIDPIQFMEVNESILKFTLKCRTKLIISYARSRTFASYLKKSVTLRIFLPLVLVFVTVSKNYTTEFLFKLHI